MHTCTKPALLHCIKSTTQEEVLWWSTRALVEVNISVMCYVASFRECEEGGVPVSQRNNMAVHMNLQRCIIAFLCICCCKECVNLYVNVLLLYLRACMYLNDVLWILHWCETAQRTGEAHKDPPVCVSRPLLLLHRYICS